jgi:hypothetical protein
MCGSARDGAARERCSSVRDTLYVGFSWGWVLSGKDVAQLGIHRMCGSAGDGC